MKVCKETLRRCGLLFCTTGLLAVTAAPIIVPAGASAQIVRGQVVDSATTTPVAGVTVLLLGTSENTPLATTVTDANGLFLINADGQGQYRLRVDYGSSRSSLFPPFDLSADDVQSYMLLVPVNSAAIVAAAADFTTIVERICPQEPVGGPSMAGWVRDSETGEPVRDADVVFSWSDVPEILREELSTSEFSGSGLTDSTGFYAICGTPLDTPIWIHAAEGERVSDFQRLTFRADGAEIGEAVVPISGRGWRQDLWVHGPAQLTTELRGTVTDGLAGGTVSGAEIELVGTSFSASTDANGRFSITGLPSGTVRVGVRHVGSEPLRQEVRLPDSGVVDLGLGQLVLGRAATALAPVRVEATATNPLWEFEERREKGTGSFLTREEFLRQGNPRIASDVLRRMQGIRIEPSTDPAKPWIISMRRAGPRTFGFAAGGDGNLSGDNCPPLFFLDRQFMGNANNVNVDQVMSLMDISAVEAHGSAASVPMEFNRRGAQCGVIAFWSNRVQPAPPQVPQESSGGFTSSAAFNFIVAIGAVVGIFFAIGQSIHF